MPKAAAPKAKPGGRYASLKLDDAGQVNWAGMSEESRTKWKEIVSSDEAKKALGLSSGEVLTNGPAGEEKPELSPLAIESFYGWLGVGQAYLFGALYKIPPEHAAQFFIFSEEEKTALTPATKRLMDKYGADFLARYGDEINIGFILSRHMVAGVNAMRAAKPKIDALIAEQKKAKEIEHAEGDNGKPKPASPIGEVTAA